MQTNTDYSLVSILISKPELLEFCGLISNLKQPFIEPKLNTVFSHIQKLYSATGKCDRKQLMIAAKADGVPIEFFSTLSSAGGHSLNILEYVRKAHDVATKQSLSNLGHYLISCCEDDLTAAREYLDKARSIIEDLEKNNTISSGVSIPEAVEIVREKSVRLAECDDDDSDYMRTGINSIDRIIQGLSVKTMSVIGARPSVGKSALGLTIMSNLALRKISVAFISVEMSEAECVERIAQLRSGVSIYEFKSNARNVESMFNGALDGIKQGKYMQIVRTTDRHIGNIRNIARKMKNNDPELKVIFIDYLQKIKGSSQNIREQVMEVSATLTDMADDLDVHICAMAQLNRDGDEMPRMTHLKESGSLEQDAHIVMLLHRLIDSDDDQAYVAIAKNRGGMVGKAQIRFEKKTTKFYCDSHDYVNREEI